MKELIDLAFYPYKIGDSKPQYPGAVSTVFKNTKYPMGTLTRLPNKHEYEWNYDRYTKESTKTDITPFYEINVKAQYEELPGGRKQYLGYYGTKIYDTEDFESSIVVGPDPTEAKSYNKWINEIKIGDFVKTKNQRNSRVWKKIIDIDDQVITCMQYVKPIDELQYFDGNSSTNLIYTIKEKYYG